MRIDSENEMIFSILASVGILIRCNSRRRKSWEDRLIVVARPGNKSNKSRGG